MEQPQGKERWDLLAEVAHLYYNEHLTQAQIGERLGTTRFKISQYLLDAREEGVVEILIHLPDNRNRQMERRLMDRFGLRQALVLNNRYLSHGETLRQLGRMASEELARQLSPGDRMGVSWGKTVQSLLPAMGDGVFPAVELLPLNGWASLENPTLEAGALAQAMAGACGGKAGVFPAPLYIQGKQLRQDLWAQPALMGLREAYGRMKAAVTGISSTSTLAVRHPLWRQYLSPPLEGELVGSVFGRLLGPQGKRDDGPLERRLMAVPEEALLSTPCRMGIALGRHKGAAVAAALRSGLVNLLVTDVSLALAVLAEEERDSRQ